MHRCRKVLVILGIQIDGDVLHVWVAALPARLPPRNTGARVQGLCGLEEKEPDEDDEEAGEDTW